MTTRRVYHARGEDRRRANQRVICATRRLAPVNQRVTFYVLGPHLGTENDPRHTAGGASDAPLALPRAPEIAISAEESPRGEFTRGSDADAHLRLWLPERYRTASAVLKIRREPQQRTPEKRGAG